MSPEEMFGEIIHSYSRADALANGDLVDVSDMARAAGFKYPVALTGALCELLHPSPPVRAKFGQDFHGRLWDTLTVLHWSARKSSPGSSLRFRVLLWLSPDDRRPWLQPMVAVCGPGDNAEPVITIMLPHED